MKKITDKHINALKLNSLKETKVLLIVIERHHSSSQLFTPEALRQATFHSLGANIINVPLNPSQYLYDMYFMKICTGIWALLYDIIENTY